MWGGLRKIGSGAAVVARRAGQALGWAATALFGRLHWQPPEWTAHAARHTRRGVAWVRAHPYVAAGRAGLVAAFVAAGLGAYYWYQSLPKPIEVAFTVTEPARTRIEVEGAKPEPLVVEFAGAVAPLAQVDKEVSGAVEI